MRTTIDLPDDLFRRAKATAALRGISLKQLVAELLEKEIPGEGETKSQIVRERPPTLEPGGRTYPYRTNAELMEVVEDAEAREEG